MAYSNYNFSGADFFYAQKQARDRIEKETGTQATQAQVDEALKNNRGYQNYANNAVQQQQQAAKNIDYWTKKYNTGLSDTTDENGVTRRTWTGQVKDPSTGKTTRQTVDVSTTQQYQERYQQYQKNLAAERQKKLTDQYNGIVDRLTKTGSESEKRVSQYQQNIAETEKKYGALEDQANRIRRDYGLDPIEKKQSGKVAGFDLVTEADLKNIDLAADSVEAHIQMAGRGDNYQAREESLKDLSRATDKYERAYDKVEIYNRQNDYVRDNASEEQGKQLLQQIEDYDRQASAAKTAAEAERARQLAARARELLEINDYYKNKAAVVGRMSDEEFSSTYTAQNLADSDELLAEATALLQQADRALNAGDSVAYNRLVQQAQALREQAYGMVGGDEEAKRAVAQRLEIKELESGVEKGRDYLKYVNLGEQKNFIPQLREWFANNQRDIGNALRNIYAESVIPSATDSDPTAGMAKAYIDAMTPTERNTYYYYLGRNDEAKAQQYFSAIEPVLEQRMSETMQVEMAEVTAEHPVLGVVANAMLSATVQPVMGTVATAENMIRSAAGEDAITSGAIYAASDLNQGAVSGLAENIQKNFNTSEESAAFWANNIVSMANNLAQTAVFRVGAVAGGAEAVSKVNEWMPLILMSTNAATETVRQELAEGSSAGKALLYGAAVGGAEILTEKMGLDSWFDLASGKTGTTFFKYITKKGVDLGGLRGAVQAVLGIGQQAITEGTEELISTFTSAVADVLINGESASLIQNQRQYITEGATKEEAFRKAMLDFAKEATQAFGGGAISGGVFGIGGAVGSLRNSNAIGEAVQNMGPQEVYALVEYGTEFAEGTKTHEIASRLAEAIQKNENYTPSAGVLTELSLAMENDAKAAMASLSEASTTAPTKTGGGGLSVTASGLISTGMVTATEAKAMNTVLNKVATNQEITEAELHVLRASAPKIREALSNMMGVEIVDGSDGAMRAAIQVFQQRQAASQKQQEAVTKAAQILKPAVAVAKGKERVAVQAEVDAAMASAESYANAEAEISGIEELAAFEAESAYEASEAPVEAKADEAPAASINYAEFSEEYRQSHPKATQEEIMTAYKTAEKSGKSAASSKKMTAQDITVEQLMEEAERQGTPMSREVAERYVAALKGSDKQFSLEEAVEAAKEAEVSTVKEGSGTEGKYSKEKPNYVAEWLARDFRKLFGKYIKSVEVRYDLPTGAGAPRGWNAGGKIVLNGQLGDTTVDGVFRSAQDILVYTLSHEVGHSAQGNTSAGYDAQTDAIIQMYRDLNPRFTDAQLEERINKEIAKNRNFARKMELAGEDAGFKASDFGRTEAREEVACNMLGEMMVDYNVLSKMMPQHKTIVQRAQTRVSEVLKAIRKFSPKASKSGEISIAKAYELAAEEIEQTLTDALEAASAKETVDGQNKVWYNDERGGDDYARTDEFRELQAESQGMPDAEWHRNLRGGADADVRRRVSDVLRRQLDSWRRSSGADHGLLNLESKGNQFNIYEDVNGALFHDVFEVARKYLKNGELVDLHTTETTEDGIGYDDCYNYLSEDGLCGFSITPSGDLISVFNMGGQGGFLRAIAPVVRDRAKTLDCYASSNQNLVEMYKKTFGFQAASVMDYNMEYDHDNIAVNHGMPQVAFMVNTPAEVVTKRFNGDQYDEAVAYRDSYVNTGAQFSLPDEPDTSDNLEPMQAQMINIMASNIAREANRNNISLEGYYAATAEINAFSLTKADAQIIADALEPVVAQLGNDNFNGYLEKMRSFSAGSGTAGSLGYHAGDLGKAESLSQQGLGRDTGHFGTGTYFVGNKAAIEGYNSRGGEPAPVETVDFSKYNLFTPNDAHDGFVLHDFLRGVDGYWDRDADAVNTMEEYENLQEKLSELVYDIESEEFGETDPSKESWVAVEKEFLTDAKRMMGTYKVGKYLTDTLNRLTDGNYQFDSRSEEYYSYNFDTGEYIDYTEDEIIQKLNAEAGGWKAFEGIESLADDYYSYSQASRYETWSESIKDVARVLGVSEQEVRNIIQSVTEDINSRGYTDVDRETADSAATRFMKALGYEGIDVRGIKGLDNTAYGSVIYDLKGEDLARKNAIGTARYSLSDDELDYLMNDFGDIPESFFDRFNGETYDSGTPYVSYDASQRMARDLLNEYGSAADVSDIAAKYRQLSTLTEPVYEWALDVWRGGSRPYDAAAAAQDEILSIASEMADIVIDNASAESQSNEEVREYLRDVLSQKVYVSDADKRDVAMAMGYESWGELRKARFGVLGNTTSDPAKGVEVADIYNGILETFPGAVKGYATEQAGQLAEIIEAYDNAREARDSEFNPLEADRERYRDEIAGRIYRDLHDKAVDYADEQHKQELALEQARARRLERQARESEKKAAEAKAGNADPKLIESLEAEATDLRAEAEDARLMGQTDSETIAEGMAEGGYTPKTQFDLWVEEANAREGRELTAQERMDQIVAEILRRNNAPKETKVSRTYSNTLVGGGFISEAEQGIEGLRAEDATYDVVSEKESLSEAKNRLDKNYVHWYDELPKREKWSGKDLDTAMLIFGQVQSESAISGDYSESIRWAQLIREKGTQGGQFLQAFRKYTKTTIGQVIDKTKDLDERYINEKGDNAALDDLRKQNKKAAKDLDQLTIDNEKLDKEYEALMERYNALRSELEEARKERNSTKGKILRAIDKTDALDKENIRLQGELDRLEDLLSWKLAEVSTVSRENRNLVVQSRRLASKLQREQQRLSDAVTRNEQLKEALAKLQAASPEESDLLRRIEAANKKLENQIAALSGEVTGAKRTKKAVDNASTAEGVRKAISKTGAEALGDYLKDVADALDSALSNDKKAALINEMAQFASTLDACKEGDKGSLIDLILRQAAVRNTPVSRGIKKSMEAQDWQFLHDVALTQMMNIAEDYKKVAVGKKLAGWQYLIQLLNPKTFLRNVGSNTVFYGQEAMAKNLGAVIDAITGKITGVRTVGASTFRRGDTGRLSAARDRARRSAIEVSLDVSVGSSNKYTGSNRTFKRAQKGISGAVARTLSSLEKVNGYSLTVTDEFFKGAVYQSAINSYARLVEKGVLTQGEAERLATEQMLYNTFQDETAIGSALEWLHNGLNGTTKWFKDHDVPVLNKLEGLGIGDFVIKYRKVPGALVTRAIEFSPAGAIKAVHNLGHIVKYAREQSALETKMKVEGEQSVTDAEIEEVRAKLIDAQHAWSMSFARTLTGSAMVAVFAALASSGIIGNAEDEEDPDARAVNAAEGLSGTQINLSALGRWMRGQSTEWQAGDDLIDLGWLDPTGSAITMGTMIANAKDAEGENFFSRWFGANKEMALQSFSDLSMMDTLNDLLYTLMYHDEESDLSMATEFAITFATSSLTSMWPSVFRQVAQATDRYYRDTYGGDGAVYDALRGFVGEDTAQAIQTAVNEVAVNIPGLRQTVDTKLDSFGRPKTYGDSTVANVLNALINPSKYAKYNPSEASRELRRVARETGDASIYPDRNAPSSLQFGNERIDLTPDQRRTWQTTMGQTYDQMVGEMMSGDAYQSADNEGKVKLLKDLESYVEYKARQEVYREVYGEEYSNDQWAKTEAGLDLGIEFGDMRKILEDTSEGNMPSLLDDNGETISGSREGQIMDYLNETAYDDETKLNLYGIIRGSGAASSTQKLREIMETGLSFEEASAVRQTYNELNATREPNLDGMRDRDSFEKYLRGEGYSDEQRQTITDRYKFYTQIPQEENASIAKMVAGGMDYDTAYDIAAKISALEPEDGEDSVSTAQKYSSVIADSTLSVGEKQMAVAAIAGTASKFGSLNEDIAENLMRVYEETGVTSVLSIQPADSVTVDYKEYKYTDEQYAASERAYLYVMNNMGGGYLTDAKLVSSAKDIASNAAKYAAMEAGGYAPDIDSSDYSAYRKASRAAELGLDLSYYVAVKTQGSSYTADKDSNGDSISGSKKEKVLNYLSSLGLTSAQYTFFKKDVFGYS